VNRLFVAAVDAQGNILCSTNRDIVSAVNITSLAGNSFYKYNLGRDRRVICVTNAVTVARDPR